RRSPTHPEGQWSPPASLESSRAARFDGGSRLLRPPSQCFPLTWRDRSRPSRSPRTEGLPSPQRQPSPRRRLYPRRWRSPEPSDDRHYSGIPALALQPAWPQRFFPSESPRREPPKVASSSLLGPALQRLGLGLPLLPRRRRPRGPSQLPRQPSTARLPRIVAHPRGTQ